MAITQKAFTTQTTSTNKELKTPQTSKWNNYVNLGYLLLSLTPADRILCSHVSDHCVD